MVDCIAMDKTGVFKPETISVEGQKGKMQQFFDPSTLGDNLEESNIYNSNTGPTAFLETSEAVTPDLQEPQADNVSEDDISQYLARTTALRGDSVEKASSMSATRMVTNRMTFMD